MTELSQNNNKISPARTCETEDERTVDGLTTNDDDDTDDGRREQLTVDEHNLVKENDFIYKNFH